MDSAFWKKVHRNAMMSHSAKRVPVFIYVNDYPGEEKRLKVLCTDYFASGGDWVRKVFNAGSVLMRILPSSRLLHGSNSRS